MFGEQRVTELAEALERFNRKERNLLIRSVLGHREAPLQLSQRFRQTLISKLNISALPENTWWATDHHVSWIAGALAVYLEDEAALAYGRTNLELNGRHLVEGNQEDIDLLVAAGQHLIMVEAKAYGSWRVKQVASKLQRLDLLLAYYDQVERRDRSIRFHLVLMSPRQPRHLPQKLKKAMPTRLSQLWPELPWIPLQLETSALEVTRCQLGGESSAYGNNWRVVTKKSESIEEE